MTLPSGSYLQRDGFEGGDDVREKPPPVLAVHLRRSDGTQVRRWKEGTVLDLTKDSIFSAVHQHTEQGHYGEVRPVFVMAD